MCKSVLSAYMSVFHMCRASKGQKWVSDPLELELGIIVSPVRILGPEPVSSARTRSTLTSETSPHFSRLLYKFSKYILIISILIRIYSNSHSFIFNFIESFFISL